MNNTLLYVEVAMKKKNGVNSENIIIKSWKSFIII